MRIFFLATFLLASVSTGLAFQPAARTSISVPSTTATTTATNVASKSPLFAAAATGSGELVASEKELTRAQSVRKEGGLLAFPTKYGALNPFAIYYGLVAIGLGIPWFVILKMYSLCLYLTRNRFDKLRRGASFINHVWGVALMRLTRCYPVTVNADILRDFYKE